MPSTRFKRILIGLLGVVGALVMCSTIYLIVVFIGRSAPSSWENPPIYPNAQNLSIENVSIRGPGDVTIQKIISFETNDTSNAVVDYYKKTLSNSGWQSIDISDVGLSYVAFRGTRAPEMYTFDISVHKPKVEIRLGYSPGE